jgi:hypothetical protein
MQDEIHHSFPLQLLEGWMLNSYPTQLLMIALFIHEVRRLLPTIS